MTTIDQVDFEAILSSPLMRQLYESRYNEIRDNAMRMSDLTLESMVTPSNMVEGRMVVNTQLEDAETVYREVTASAAYAGLVVEALTYFSAASTESVAKIILLQAVEVMTAKLVETLTIGAVASVEKDGYCVPIKRRAE